MWQWMSLVGDIRGDEIFVSELAQWGPPSCKSGSCWCGKATLPLVSWCCLFQSDELDSIQIGQVSWWRRLFYLKGKVPAVRICSLCSSSHAIGEECVRRCKSLNVLGLVLWLCTNWKCVLVGDTLCSWTKEDLSQKKRWDNLVENERCPSVKLISGPSLSPNWVRWACG
jgi:hypothetical protein